MLHCCSPLEGRQEVRRVDEAEHMSYLDWSEILWTNRGRTRDLPHPELQNLSSSSTLAAPLSSTSLLLPLSITLLHLLPFSSSFFLPIEGPQIPFFFLLLHLSGSDHHIFSIFFISFAIFFS